MAKTIFIIPGYRQTRRNKAYRKLTDILRNEGFTPHPVDLSWRGKTISENTEIFLKQYKKIKSRKKYILGFSYGAMVAFLASTKVHVSGLILCSLSPYFKEDLSQFTNKNASKLKQYRYKDFAMLSCENLAKQIKAEQTILLYGSEEEKSLINRVISAYKMISSEEKYLLSVADTDHNIGDKHYLATIRHGATMLF